MSQSDDRAARSARSKPYEAMCCRLCVTILYTASDGLLHGCAAMDRSLSRRASAPLSADELAALMQRLQSLTQRRNAHTSSADSRLQLGFIQQLEDALQQQSCKVVKEHSHDLMSSLLSLLDSGCTCSVRLALYRECHAAV